MTHAIQVSVEKTGSENSLLHPLGSRARVLLVSVFGPYAQDDEYGSRTINPMELYHNQVTRVHNASSASPELLRIFHGIEYDLTSLQSIVCVGQRRRP